MGCRLKGNAYLEAVAAADDDARVNDSTKPNVSCTASWAGPAIQVVRQASCRKGHYGNVTMAGSLDGVVHRVRPESIPHHASVGTNLPIFSSSWTSSSSAGETRSLDP